MVSFGSPGRPNVAPFGDWHRRTTGQWHPFQQLGRLGLRHQDELPIRGETTARPAIFSALKRHGLHVGEGANIDLASSSNESRKRDRSSIWATPRE